MVEATAAAPVGGSERIDLLDAVRGFALAGVFVANMHSFSGWFMLGQAEQSRWRDRACAKAGVLRSAR